MCSACRRYTTPAASLNTNQPAMRGVLDPVKAKSHLPCLCHEHCLCPELLLPRSFCQADQPGVCCRGRPLCGRRGPRRSMRALRATQPWQMRSWWTSQAPPPLSQRLGSPRCFLFTLLPPCYSSLCATCLCLLHCGF